MNCAGDIMVQHVWIILLILAQAPTCSTSSPTGGVSRPSYGVDFNFLFQVNNLHGSWKHIFSLDLNVLDRQEPDNPPMDCDTKGSVMCHTMVDFLTRCKHSFWNLTSLFSSFNEWAHDPQILATLNRGTRRQKRSLFPFIGDIEKALFGVATESDINGIRKSIEDFTKLGENYKDQITNLGENLASLSKISQEQTANTKKGFALVKATFANLTNQINARIKELSSQINRQNAQWSETETTLIQMWPVLEGAFHLLVKTLLVVDADIQLLQGIQQILTGYIPITMISPKELTQGLQIAEEGIRRSFPGARLSYSERNLGYYYTHQIVTPMIESNHIQLIVDLPVDLGQQILNVYSVRTFPVPMMPYDPYSATFNSKSHVNAQSELSAQDEYFLVSQDGNQYSTASQLDISLCKGETVRSCKKQFALIPMTQISCLQQLWTDAPFSKMLEVCPYQLSHALHATNHVPFVQVRSLAEGRWYINTPLDDKWIIRCPSMPPDIRSPCTSCVIQVDCGCGVKSKYFEIPTRLSSCNSVFSPLSKNFTVNPFSYLSHEDPWVLNLTGTAMSSSPLDDPPTIHLPSSENWDDVMESMDHKSYDLNRLYLKQMNQTRMFRSEAEALLEKIRTQDRFLDAISGWPSWIVGLGLGLSFINFFGFLGLCYCLLSRAAHAQPLLQGSRFANEPALSDNGSGAILSIECIILIVCLLNLILLSILTWPILSQWIQNNRYFRRFVRAVPQIKAVGFVPRRIGSYLLFEGTGLFLALDHSRPIVFKILIACLKSGWGLNNLREVPKTATAEIENGTYCIRFSSPIFLVDENGDEREFFHVNVPLPRLHQKLLVGEDFPLTSMMDCKVYVMRV